MDNDPYADIVAPAPATPPVAASVPADPYSDIVAPKTQSADPYADVVAPPAVTPISDDEFQQKQPRWGPMLTGNSMASPADIAEMQSSGRYTPEQIQRVQTETGLRQQYIDEQAKTFGQKTGDVVSAAGAGVGGMLKDLTYPFYGAWKVPSTQTPGNIGNSLIEGGSEAATGITGLAGKLVTGPLSYIKDAYNQVTGKQQTPEEQEKAYQDWKLNYVNTHAVPGYAPPSTSSRAQDLEAALTGKPAESFPAPYAPLTSAVSTGATIPLYGGVGKVAEAVIPKALEAAGATALAPNLSKLVSPASNVDKLRDAMNSAATPAVAPVTAGEKVAAGITSAANKVAEGAAALPAKTAAVAGKTISGAGAVAQAPAKFLNWAASKLPKQTASSDILTGVALSHVPMLNKVLYVVKGLESAGTVAAGVGDFMTRVAEADPADPLGRFMSAAAQKDAPAWMKTVAQYPPVQTALDLGNLAGSTLKGVAKGAATGAALGLASGDNPEEIGGNIAGMGLFGAAHEGMSAKDSSIFQAHIGSVTKFITDSLASGTSPDTLRLVPADQVLQASLWSSINPDSKIRFATTADAASPFTKGGVAENQAGYFDRDNKTLWVDPTKRAPGQTLTHESFHPIFDNLVAQRPAIKSSLDTALQADGRSIDDFKQQYANRAYPNDPAAAANYIKTQDTISPDWGYSELLADSAAHELSGKDLLEAAQGKETQQSATQAALNGTSGWLSAQGVGLKKTLGGTVFPDFENVFTSPEVRKLTYRLLKAQRDTTAFGKTTEDTGRPLTDLDMGKAPAPMYPTPQGDVNAYGRMLDDGKGGKVFKPWPASELRKRAKAEFDARKNYFQPGQMVNSMPAGLEADPNIAPWTKAALRGVFDAVKNKTNLSMWYHRLNGENSSTSQTGWKGDVRRTLGNAQVSWQHGKPLGVEITKQGNLITRWESEEAENQKLADWAGRHGPLSLDLWHGDQGAAKADIQTYLQNHATGQPGDANGIGTAKRDVINALLAGGNKEFEASNPLRASIRGADRQGVMRSLRIDRMESAKLEQTQRAPAQWESLKRNLSPAEQIGLNDLPKKRDIELTGPDGKKYPATYDGIQDDFRGGGLLQVTPKVDLPGATAQHSTTYHSTLEKNGYKLPQELYDELNAYKKAQAEPGLHAHQFSPSEDPNAIAAAAVRDKKGKVWVGSSHSAARWASPKAPMDLEDGFVTNNGKFVTRDKALAQAVASKQYKPNDEDYNVNKILYQLTSERFNKQNPNSYAGVARANEALDKNGKQGNTKRRSYSPAVEEKNTRQPDQNIRDQAAGYMDEQGLENEPFTGYKPLNSDLGKRVADAYEAAPHIPDDPKVQASYQALAKETRAQWDYLTKQGVSFEPWTKEGQPYENSAAMRKDVQDNNHLYFFPSEQGFGEGEAKSNNPMLQPTGITSGGVPLVTNDLFRAVHDYFGHAKEGYEFGPRGEYNAYLAHSRMFSDAALPALTAETMGQNSWVNFGKHLRDEAGNIPKKGEKNYVAPQDRPFAEQKATAIPDELTKESLNNPKGTFSPAAPESLTHAAVRVDKEDIFTSDSHSGAFAKARKAGVVTEDDHGGPRTEDGFMTTAGRFVNRAEGYKLAERAQQLRTTEPALTDNGRWLDSSNIKRFSPSAPEKEETLSYPMEMAPGKASGKLPGLLTAPYAAKAGYQNDMLKAMKPLFDAFGAKPGETTKSSYKNSAGEVEYNPATSVELPADKGKLFGLLHGLFTDQEAVAGGYKEVKPGDWQPVSAHSFSETPDYAEKIKAAGPEAEKLLAKLQPEIVPAVQAVNTKWENQLGLQPQQFSPSTDPRAVKMSAVRDEETGKVYTGAYHGEAFEKYFAANPDKEVDEDNENTFSQYQGIPDNLTEGFVTNKGEFLDRQEALARATELKQYKSDFRGDEDYGLESVAFEHQQRMKDLLEHAKEPGTPVAAGTFSPPAMADKTWQSLAGKRMIFVIGDTQDAGRDYITEHGNAAVPLMGGPGYPHLPGNEGKAGWATTAAHTTRLSNALKHVDYMAVVAGSPDMVAGSISFAKAYLAELNDAVKAGTLKLSALDRLARDVGRRIRNGNTSKGYQADIPAIHNFAELERLATTTRTGRLGPRAVKGSQGVAFPARAEFWKFIGSSTNEKKYGTPLYASVREKFNEAPGTFEPGQIVQIIKVNHNKPLGSAAEHGVIEHPSYETVIPGTGLGQPPSKLMMGEALKPWLESPESTSRGGDARYKVQQMMPQTEINPESFKK